MRLSKKFEDGTVVEMRNGCRYFVTDGGLWNTEGFKSFADFYNNLNHIHKRKDCDIVKKYILVEGTKISENIFNDINLILVWWRPTNLTGVKSHDSKY